MFKVKIGIALAAAGAARHLAHLRRKGWDPLESAHDAIYRLTGLVPQVGEDLNGLMARACKLTREEFLRIRSLIQQQHQAGAIPTEHFWRTAEEKVRGGPTPPDTPTVAAVYYAIGSAARDASRDGAQIG